MRKTAENPAGMSHDSIYLSADSLVSPAGEVQPNTLLGASNASNASEFNLNSLSDPTLDTTLIDGGFDQFEKEAETRFKQGDLVSGLPGTERSYESQVDLNGGLFDAQGGLEPNLDVKK